MENLKKQKTYALATAFYLFLGTSNSYLDGVAHAKESFSESSSAETKGSESADMEVNEEIGKEKISAPKRGTETFGLKGHVSTYTQSRIPIFLEFGKVTKGAKILERKVSFNNDGNIVSDSQYDAEHQNPQFPRQSTVSKYNKDGYVSEVVISSPQVVGGKMSMVQEFKKVNKYDDAGRLIESTLFPRVGPAKEKFSFRYTPSERKVETRYSTEGKLIGGFSESYDSYGKLLSTESSNFYDSYGNLLQTEGWDINVNISKVSETKNSFDEYGQLSSAVTYDRLGRMISSTEYGYSEENPHIRTSTRNVKYGQEWIGTSWKETSATVERVTYDQKNIDSEGNLKIYFAYNNEASGEDIPTSEIIQDITYYKGGFPTNTPFAKDMVLQRKLMEERRNNDIKAKYEQEVKQKEFETEMEAGVKSMKDAEAYFDIGILYDHKGQYDKAIEAYEKAIELKPDYGEAYFRLKFAYRSNGQLDKAIQAYEKSCRIDDKYCGSIF